jgi:hypothetical protein
VKAQEANNDRNIAKSADLGFTARTAAGAVFSSQICHSKDTNLLDTHRSTHVPATANTKSQITCTTPFCPELENRTEKAQGNASHVILVKENLD